MYLLTDQIMNGTITMQIMTIGIEAENFQDAIIKVKNLQNFGKATIYTENDSEFTYSISNQQFPCYGRMENKVLKII